MATNLGRAIGYLELNTDKWVSGFNRAKQQMQTLSDSSASMSNRFKSAGALMTSAGSAMTKAITLPLVAVGTASVKTAADFESAMSKVKAVSGATGEEFTALENKAKEMGMTTSKSARESAEAMSYMALAGWDTTQIISGIEPVLRLSEAAGTDLARTSDLVTDSMSALGLEVQDLSGYLDICAQAQRKSNTSADQMLEAYIACGGTMKNLGITTQESATALGVLANRGKKGSEAGTALNSIMVNLTSGTGQAGKAMKELGISCYDSEGNFKGLKVVFDELNEALANCTNEQRDTYLAMIGGKTQLDTLNALLSGASEEWDTLSDSLGNCDGTLNEVSKTMQDNLNGQLTALKSALEGAGIAIGNALLPMIKGLVSIIQSAVEWFNGLSDGMKTTIVVIGGIVAAIGPLLLILGSFAGAIGNILALRTAIEGLSIAGNIIPAITGAFSGFIATIGGLFTGLVSVITGTVIPTLSSLWAVMLANPIGIIIAVIAALVAAFLYCWKNVDGFKEFFINAWNTIKSTASSAISSIVSKISQMASDFLTKGKQAANNFKNAIINGLKSIPLQVVSIGRSIVQGLWNGITGAGGWLKSKISGFANSVLSGFKSAFKINSPSKIMRDIIGVGIVEGIGVGMEQEESSLLGTAKSLANNVVSTMQGGIELGKALDTNVSSNFGNSVASTIGSLLHIDTVVINDDKDVETLANDLAFYLSRKGLPV